MIRSIRGRSLFLGTLGVLLFAGPSSAQVIFGLNVGAGMPIGDLKDVAKVGFGGAATVGVMLGSSRR